LDCFKYWPKVKLNIDIGHNKNDELYH
jgi:hypothetical protein